MRLSETFTQLPLICDSALLRKEVSGLDERDWRAHPSQFNGNSAALLITVNGEENDSLAHVGQFKPTPLLSRMPYTRQIMRSLQAPLSRSRFMRVAPACQVPLHNDVGWHWFRRVRVHVPVITTPEVIFHCAGRSIHMAAGEVWIFDNFEDHSVDNDSELFRIHLVIDVVPTAAFFDLVRRGRHPFGTSNPGFQPRPVAPITGVEAQLPIESHEMSGFTPSELSTIVRDIGADLAGLRPERGASMAKAELRKFSGAVARDNDYESCRNAARRLCSALLPVYHASALGKTSGRDMLAVLYAMSFGQDKPRAFERFRRWSAALLRGEHLSKPRQAETR